MLDGALHTRVCQCCGVDVHPEKQSDRPALPFCRRCVPGSCRKTPTALAARWPVSINAGQVLGGCSNDASEADRSSPEETLWRVRLRALSSHLYAS